MKTIKYFIMLTLLYTTSGLMLNAQETRSETTSKGREGWTQGRAAIFSVGVGGTRPIAVGRSYAFLLYPGASINFSGEFRVHRFVGFGFQTGINTYFERGRVIRYYPDRAVVSSWRTSIGIPLALKVNVHILEAANNRHADYLDVYAGLNVGGGPAFTLDPTGYTFGFIHAGPQVGIRYWPSRSIAVFGEVGWGATFANIGLTF